MTYGGNFDASENHFFPLNWAMGDCSKILSTHPCQIVSHFQGFDDGKDQQQL